jgi:hypothetical protein
MKQNYFHSLSSIYKQGGYPSRLQRRKLQVLADTAGTAAQRFRAGFDLQAREARGDAMLQCIFCGRVARALPRR